MHRSPTPASHEPSLDELFAEPIIQLLMQRDGIHANEMQHQLYRLRQRYPTTAPQ